MCYPVQKRNVSRSLYKNGKAVVLQLVDTLQTSPKSVVSTTTTTTTSSSGLPPDTPLVPPMRKRGVSFAPQVKAVPHISIFDMTEIEIEAVWTTPQEQRSIMMKCARQVQRMTQQAKNETGCSRGLESHTTLGSLAKHQNRVGAYRAVLDLQDSCSLEYDETRIRAVYENVTQSSQLWAHHMGLQDRKAADCILDEEDDELDRLLDRCHLNHFR